MKKKKTNSRFYLSFNLKAITALVLFLCYVCVLYLNMNKWHSNVVWVSIWVVTISTLIVMYHKFMKPNYKNPYYDYTSEEHKFFSGENKYNFRGKVKSSDIDFEYSD